jgi:alkylation response protein AidB-like acyl-CoA dehydrogenase
MQVLAQGAEDLASGLSEVLKGMTVEGRAAEADGESRRKYWSELVRDEWPLLGVQEDGDGLSTVDLCRVAEEWGRAMPPVPLMPTVLARRWGGPAADATNGTPLTVALPAGPGTSWVPFADFPGVQVVGWEAVPVPVDAGAWQDVDAFAPTCTVGTAVRESTLPADQVAEMQVLGLAEVLGTASQALADSVEYTKGRHQFGRPIGSFQAVQHLLADMQRDVEIGRSLVLCAAHATDATLRDAALAEGFLRSRTVVEGAIQAHGGMGFTWELGLHYSLRHIIALAKIYTHPVTK